MDTPKQTKKLYYFGEFRLDETEHRLWREDQLISLTPKQFELLFYFVRNAGRITSKTELLDAVWKDTFIEETTLARNVSWLRQKLGECSNGESFIETVPKHGYRFMADVVDSDEDNAYIIEEETIQYIRGEETFTIKDAKKEKNSIFQFVPPKMIFAAIALVALVGIGTVLYSKNFNTNSQTLNKNKTGRNIPTGAKIITIGSIVHLQNRYPNDGSYLDAWGDVWSKPEFEKVPTETMFVSTHKKSDRDNGSGSWEIVSANGKSEGESLVIGDRIHLKNMYPNAGYLDACGWVEHLPVFDKFTEQTGAVFTTRSPNRDNGTGVWIIRSATEADGTPVLEGDSIAIESSYFINDKGINRVSGFLNVTGKVNDIPSFNDYDGLKLVFTQSISYNQSAPDIWTITISKAVLE